MPGWDLTMKSVRNNPWFQPAFFRFALSLVIVVYIFIGATVFLALTAQTEGSTKNSQPVTFERRKNETAILLATELRLLKPQDDVWPKTILKHLSYLERYMRREAANSPLTPLFDSRGRQHSTNFERSFYFTLSLLSATASIDLLALDSAMQVAIIIYTSIGLPLVICWICLMGKTLAQLWILLCMHMCCCGMSTNVNREPIFRSWWRRLRRKSQPEVAPENEKQRHFPAAINMQNEQTYHDQGSRSLLVEPEDWDTYLRLNQSDLWLPLWTLVLVFLLYAIFGATFGAVTHGVPFMRCFFYGFLIYSSIGGLSHDLSVVSLWERQIASESVQSLLSAHDTYGVKTLWLIYFLGGYSLLSAMIYMTYLLFTWRCLFCRAQSVTNMHDATKIMQ